MMRPSSSKATSAWWIWPRSWLALTKCSQRSSVHFTLRPSRMRGEREQDLLGVEDHDLGAEAAAGVGRLERELIRRQAEDPAEPELERDRRLGRRPDVHAATARVPLDRDATALERAREAALDRQVERLGVRRGGEGGVRVARVVLDEPGDVVGRVLVDDARAVARGRQVHDRRQAARSRPRSGRRRPRRRSGRRRRPWR